MSPAAAQEWSKEENAAGIRKFEFTRYVRSGVETTVDFLYALKLDCSSVGVVFVIAPFALKFFGLDAWYYWVLAAAVLLTTSVFNAPEQPVAMRLGLDRRTAG